MLPFRVILQHRVDPQVDLGAAHGPSSLSVLPPSSLVVLLLSLEHGVHVRAVVQHVVELGASNIVEHRSEEHTSELQSRENLVCRLLLEKKKPGVLTACESAISR